MSKKIPLIFVVLATATLSLVACNKDTTNTEPLNSAKPAVVSSEAPLAPVSSKAPTTTNKDMNKTTEKTFTVEELKKFNGENGNPSYVAISGTVYDVSNNKAWKNGMHKGNTAGKDLSQELLTKSPHGEKVLPELPIVGKLVK